MTQAMPTYQTKPGEPFRDPKDIITPHAFQLDPRLLGIPLATPMRRAWAILIDGIGVSMLSKAGGVMLALAGAILIFDMWKTKGDSTRSKALLYPLRLLGAIMVFALATAVLQPLWDKYAASDDDQGQIHTQVKNKNHEDVALSPVEIAGFTAGVLALNNCEDAICRVQKTEALTRLVGESHESQAKKREMLMDVVRDVADDTDEQVALTKIIDKGLGVSVPTPEEIGAQASNQETELRQALAEQQAEVERLRADNKALKEGSEGFSFMKLFRNLVDDLGVGVGWSAVYFTVFTAWWRGQTPGKRLLGIRVVQLNGKNIGLWDAFSRYGGYAAGLATGLLGFAQVFWDPNRQAIHDKISFTAVIRDVGGHTVQDAKAAAKDHEAAAPRVTEKSPDQGEEPPARLGQD